MNLHEYQAKQLFADYGMPVPNNRVVASADEVPGAIADLAGQRWIVKAQVHAGGRGKAGGVKLVDKLAELKMLRSLQHRINRRTKRLGRMIDGEQAQKPDVVTQLQELSNRQGRVQDATYDLVTGKNR